MKKNECLCGCPFRIVRWRPLLAVTHTCDHIHEHPVIMEPVPTRSEAMRAWREEQQRKHAEWEQDWRIHEEGVL